MDFKSCGAKVGNLAAGFDNEMPCVVMLCHSMEGVGAGEMVTMPRERAAKMIADGHARLATEAEEVESRRSSALLDGDCEPRRLAPIASGRTELRKLGQEFRNAAVYGERLLAVLHRLDMVVAGPPGPGSVALLRPQRSRLLDLQYEGRRTCLKRIRAVNPMVPNPN